MCPVIFRAPPGHCPPLLGWALMKFRWKCPTCVPPVSCYYQITYRFLRSHSASNVPAPSLRDKLKCVRPISDEIGRKRKIRFPTSFRPAIGFWGRGAINTICHRYWFLTEICSFMLCSNQKSLPFQKCLKVWKAMSQKLFQVDIPNKAQIVFNYYQMDCKCYFGYIYIWCGNHGNQLGLR